MAKPLPSTLTHQEIKKILTKRETLLRKVKMLIDGTLNPLVQVDNAPELSICQLLDSINIKKDDYYKAFSIASGDEYELHLKRDTKSCFINNYNPTLLLLAWQANIDIQPVFNYCKFVAYHTRRKVKLDVLRPLLSLPKRHEEKMGS